MSIVTHIISSLDIDVPLDETVVDASHAMIQTVHRGGLERSTYFHIDVVNSDFVRFTMFF